MDGVPFLLGLVDGDHQVIEGLARFPLLAVLHVTHRMDRIGHQSARLHQHGTLIDKLAPHRFDFVEHRPLRDGIDHVDDVVDPRN